MVHNDFLDYRAFFLLNQVTPELIEQQISLEREAMRHGLKSLRDDTMKAENREYASNSLYGRASIKAVLPKVTQRISDTTDRIYRGTNGPLFKEIREFLNPLEPLAAASIALKITFDKVFGYRLDSGVLQNVADAISLAIEAECKMRYYERVAPGILKRIKEDYWHSSSGTGQKLRTVTTLMNRKDIPPWKPWNRSLRSKLGVWLLDCVVCSTGYFTKLTQAKSKRRKETYIVPTSEFSDIKDQLMKQAELFSPAVWPMLVPPKPWSNTEKGGFLLNELMEGHSMVRRGTSCIQGQTPIDFLNHIQRTSYVVSKFILDVAEVLEERQYSVGKFVPILETPLPNKPLNIDTDKSVEMEYRRAAAKAHDQNAQAFKRSCRTRHTLEAARRFKDYDRWYLCWSLDYRGRAYPLQPYLSVQDTDFGKALIRFAEPAFMTPEAEGWLRFMCATCYGKDGLDKSTMQERLDWTKNNHSLITRVATDPIGNISDWETADEPWQFLSACEEYHATCIECSRQYTSLMVATDASCSGIQILSGLSRDKSAASLVNVVPSSKPQDAYKVVADKAKPNIPEHLHEVWDRKCVKRVVMTLPYSAKEYSNRHYVRDALEEKGLKVTKEDINTTVKAVRAAMDEVLPGPMRVMKWIEEEVAKAIKAGATELTWTTPSGFVVVQRLMKSKYERVTLQLLGKVNMRVATGDSDEVDINHHKNATSPNLIHSLDSSLLHLCAIRFNAPIALIHDSVLCRATDMSNLSTLVRETYMHLFAEHDYLRDFADSIGAETKPPIIGDLCPETVIHSTYFFC